MAFDISKNPLVDYINNLMDYVANHKKKVAYYLIGLLTMVGVVLGYLYYQRGIQKRAHKDFLTAFAVFNAKVTKNITNEQLPSNEFKNEADKWKAVDAIFDKMYKKNSRSGIAPFFLAYRVDALLNLNRLADAINVQSELLGKIPNKSNLKPYSEIKLALMKIDTNLSNKVDEGLIALQKIAYQKGNVAQDEALYRLGEYYWNLKNFKESLNYWNQLVIQFGENSKYPSVWVNLVKPKLETISV